MIRSASFRPKRDVTVSSRASCPPNRFHNKGVYVKVGLQKISSTRSLQNELHLQVDAQNVPLPNIEGLIFLNIPR